MWGVPLSAGLPCGARVEVVRENSLRGPWAAPLKQLPQVSQRCALRAPTSTLRSSAPTRRPAGSQPSPLAPRLVARHEPATMAWHQRGTQSRVGGWRGACVGVAGTQAGPGLPLASGKGMASMSEPAGRVAQPPGLDKVPESSPAQRDRPHEALPATDSAPPRAAPKNRGKATQKTGATACHNRNRNSPFSRPLLNRRDSLMNDNCMALNVALACSRLIRGARGNPARSATRSK